MTIGSCCYFQISILLHIYVRASHNGGIRVRISFLYLAHFWDIFEGVVHDPFLPERCHRLVSIRFRSGGAVSAVATKRHPQQEIMGSLGGRSNISSIRFSAILPRDPPRCARGSGRSTLNQACKSLHMAAWWIRGTRTILRQSAEQRVSCATFLATPSRFRVQQPVYPTPGQRATSCSTTGAPICSHRVSNIQPCVCVSLTS